MDLYIIYYLTNLEFFPDLDQELWEPKHSPNKMNNAVVGTRRKCSSPTDDVENQIKTLSVNILLLFFLK